MAPSRERDILYMLFAVQLGVLSNAASGEWDKLLLLLAVMLTALLALREYARISA